MKKGPAKKSAGNSKLNSLAAKAKKEQDGEEGEGGEKKKKAPRRSRTGLTREQKKELDQQVADQAKSIKKKIIIGNVVLFGSLLAWLLMSNN